jgi:hypothetical protein
MLPQPERRIQHARRHFQTPIVICECSYRMQSKSL